MAATELTLLSRSYCHLCHDMEVALAPLAEEFGATVSVVDVDADPALERHDVLAVAVGQGLVVHEVLGRPGGGRVGHAGVAQRALGLRAKPRRPT